MENRFTIKDLFLTFLMLAVIGVVILAMFQYDRQWDTLKQLQKQADEQNKVAAEQTRLLSDIRGLLEKSVSSGAVLTPSPTRDAVSVPQPATQPAGTFASAKGDPFKYIDEAVRKPDYARGDWLVENFGAKVGKLTPMLSSDVYGSVVQNRVMEQLAYRDPETFEWVPQLATDWKISEDGLVATITLRRGVTFSDGAPFSAEDVVFTVNWALNPDVEAPRWRAGLEPLEKIEKTGDYEVVFTFKRPYFEWQNIALGMSPLSKAFYGRFTPKQFNEHVGLLIGTGPYRLRDPEGWRPGSGIELIRNERYWGTPAPFNRIYYREVEEDAAELTMFRNGELDRFGAQPEQYDMLKEEPTIQQHNNRYEYFFRDGGYTYIAWNQSRVGKPTFFADKRVRQAMTLLIDRQRIVNDVFRGYGKLAVGPFGVSSLQNDPEIQPWPYDVKKAIALLAEVGFKSRNDRGVLVNADGAEFRFKLTYSNANPLTEKIVLQIKDSLARAGIIMEQEPTDWPVMVKKLDTRDFDAITLGWTGGIETDIYQMFHSSQIKDGADNFMSYSNPELDAAIEEARKTVDSDLRMPIWRKAHRILHEDQPYTFLIFGKSLAFMDKRFQNVRETRSGLNYFGQDTMPIPWYVPRAMQKHVE